MFHVNPHVSHHSPQEFSERLLTRRRKSRADDCAVKTIGAASGGA
jgi:hypothetical protein